MIFSNFKKILKSFFINSRGKNSKIGHEMLFDINLSHSLKNLHAQPHPRAKRNTRREKSIENLLNHEHFRTFIEHYTNKTECLNEKST